LRFDFDAGDPQTDPMKRLKLSAIVVLVVACLANYTEVAGLHADWIKKETGVVFTIK